MFKKIKSRLSLQITLIILAMVVLCAMAVGISSYVLYRGDTIESNARRAESIAETLAAGINAEQFEAIMESGQTNAYWDSVKTMLDDTKKRTDVKYMYVLSADYDDEMTYFAEGYDPATDPEEEAGLGYTEALVIDGEDTYAAEMFETLNTGEPTVSELYESGEFGTMVSGFAAIMAPDGRVVGVVGVDISLEEVMSSVDAFALRIEVIILFFAVAAAFFSVWFVRRHIGRPIGQLTEASDQMAQGSVDVELSINRSDEIGLLADSFKAMAQHSTEQAQVLSQLADGDLTMDITPRSENDLISRALHTTLEKLNDLFSEVSTSSTEVANGADYIASGAQNLAEGSTHQAATLQQFSAEIDNVLSQSQENTEAATRAQEETTRTGALMAESMQFMGQLSASMEEINQSSEKIAGVIKVVDDIAFQTNILALNAAVEAARAGEHGKGFAVVADEVRNLAQKSAEAAKETAQMIEENISKVAEGAQIADQTQGTLQSVNDIAAGNAEAMERINTASSAQSQSISEISKGIGELSQVVQANSATAEESAASAEEMSSQAQVLNSLVGRFRLKNGLPAHGGGQGQKRLNS